MNGTAAAPGYGDAFVYASTFGASVTLPISAADDALKVAYAGEAVRFDGSPDENYSSHRVAWNGQLTNGAWRFIGEGSILLVAGSRETEPSVSSVNANAISLWRERRRQWQDRLKLQAQASSGALLTRITGSLLDYDYQTRAVAGKVPFANRSDLQGTAEVGGKQNANSLWLTGVKVGHQNQAIVPLPNCGFDYTNNYWRLLSGWEGKPSATTSVSIAAGPDFRHYSGAIDPRVFLGGRNRTSLWFDGVITAKPRADLVLMAKATRMNWLSSTGKSAYIDSSMETAAAWTVSPDATLRVAGKVHRCDYFPAVRDDWESMLSASGSLKMSDRTLLALEILRHTGWNSITTITGREFQRTVINLSATIKY